MKQILRQGRGKSVPLDTGMKPVRKHNLLWGKKGRKESADFFVVVKHEEVIQKKIVCV